MTKPGDRWNGPGPGEPMKEAHLRTITLGGAKAAGRVALIDDADLDLVSPYSWRVYERRYPTGRTDGPYAWTTLQRDGKKKWTSLHTLITGWPLIDHINHDGLDCRRSNLRPASVTQNQMNRRPNLGAHSPYKGVTWDRCNRTWVARIKVNGKSKFLGLFVTELEAAVAYNAAAAEFFGEFACLNQLPDGQ